MRARLRLRLRLHQIATLCLWDVASNAKNGFKNVKNGFKTHSLHLKPILCICIKLQTKTHSVNGP